MISRKPIPQWEEYEIDTQGNIFRVKKSCGATTYKMLKWTIMNTGYAKVALSRNSKRKEYLVHRLVAITFLKEPGNLDVCHFDGNKLNNNLNNLRIDTRFGNMQDQIRLGKTPRGEKCGSNKYSTELIKSIRARLANGEKVSQIHLDTNIPKPTLYNIKNKYTWTWL